MTLSSVNHAEIKQQFPMCYITQQMQPLRSDLLQDVGGRNPLIIASSKTDFMFFWVTADVSM